MFRYYEPAKYPSLYDASTQSLQLLSGLVAKGQNSKHVVEGDSKQIATLVWSLLHGVATILSGRKMPQAVMGDNTPEELVTMFVDMLYTGLKNRAG